IVLLTLMGASSLTRLDRYGGYNPPTGAAACELAIIQQEGKIDETCVPRVEVGTHNARMLRFSVLSQSPKFKVLLYAYRHRRSPMPKYRFSPNGELIVQIGQQLDRISFVETANGRTAFKLQRESKGPAKTPLTFEFGLH
ncbi:MAG: hypothetical protein D6820_10355, partial [Lentisphaerae bacterium]